MSVRTDLFARALNQIGNAVYLYLPNDQRVLNSVKSRVQVALKPLEAALEASDAEVERLNAQIAEALACAYCDDNEIPSYLEAQIAAIFDGDSKASDA